MKLSIFLGLLLTSFSLSAMESVETKINAAEEIEEISYTQEQLAALATALQQKPTTNSEVLAAFYQELDTLPKVVQLLIRQYLIGQTSLDYGMVIKLFIGLHANACIVTEPQDVSKLSGDALLKVYREQFALMSDILTVASEDGKKDEDLIPSKPDMTTDFVFAIPHNGIIKFIELFDKSHPEVRRLLPLLPEAAQLFLRPLQEGATEASLALAFYKKCTGSCEIHIDLDSNAPIALHNNTGIFTLVAPVLQEEIEHLTKLGFEPAHVPQFLADLRSLQKKLKDSLVSRKLTGKVILAISLEEDKWMFSLQQPTISCDEDATHLRKTLWTLSVLNNNLIHLYNGSTGRTSALRYVEGQNVVAENSLCLIGIQSLYKMSTTLPLRDIALFTLIQDKDDELIKTQARTHVIDELEDYWQSFFNNLNSDRRKALAQYAPNLFKPKKQSWCVIS
jgi:hypothetical protein